MSDLKTKLKLQTDRLQRQHQAEIDRGAIKRGADFGEWLNGRLLLDSETTSSLVRSMTVGGRDYMQLLLMIKGELEELGTIRPVPVLQINKEFQSEVRLMLPR